MLRLYVDENVHSMSKEMYPRKQYKQGKQYKQVGSFADCTSCSFAWEFCVLQIPNSRVVRMLQHFQREEFHISNKET